MTGIGRRQMTGLVALLIVTMGACLVRLLVYRDLDGVVTWTWPAGEIARVRLTAIASAAIVGTALAVSGVLLQALLRNALASPFILGVSSGAALGVMAAGYAATVLGMTWVTGFSSVGPALVGALGALGLVYALGRRRGLIDPLSLVLVGVIVSSICAALIMLLQHLAPHGLRSDLVGWMMGHIRQGTAPWLLVTAGGITLFGAIVSGALGRAMDGATFGDDEARSIGVRVGPLRRWMFVLAGALAAVAVALAGPIGFVGLVAPHAGRLLLGPRHTALVPGAALLGVLLLVLGDTLSQVIGTGTGHIPVGVFTALVGGPAFIWLLRTGRGQA
ncbi:MAG: iron ABC transporter permease [Planctomycetes bacterium]|nr:iron ABC transporter permease [Planctomycetota bacterium]